MTAKGTPDAEVTADTTSPALPPGADTDNVGDWQTWNDVACRLVWSHPMPLPDRLARYDVRGGPAAA
jgi:hypothetical protein